ncbi:MAG: tycC5, partial [Bryobacterales bacterium]|nr:tycC5 [Bryobacterales bacterium]
LEGFPCFLTTALTEEDLEKVASAFERSLTAMARGGLLPCEASAQLPEVIAARSAAPTEAEASGPGDAPLTEAQLEVWLAAQLSPEASCAFNECFSVRLEGSVREDLLTESLNGLVRRHQALRATISEDGETVRFRPFKPFPVPVEDLTALDEVDRDKRVQQVFAQEGTHPFSLLDGPLFRARLVRLSGRETLLVMTGHHIICDGWSINVLLSELAQLYSGAVTGAPCSLAPAKPFGQYAAEQHSFKRSAEWRRNEAFWVGQYKTIPPVLGLPTDRLRPAVKGFAGGTYRSAIESSLANAVRSAGAKQGCTLFVTLLSAFEALLFRLTGQDDLAVGIPSAAQSQESGGPLVGHGVNFLPLRATRADGMTFAELLKDTRSKLLDAYEHQNYTYGTLVRQLNIPRDPARLPLVEVQFNLEKIGADVCFAGLGSTVDSGPKHFTNFDLFLNIVESPAGLTLDCDYNAEVFDEATVAGWMRHFSVLLQSVADNPMRPLMRVPMLSAVERDELVYGRNQTEAPYSRTECVQHLIAAQAVSRPDQIAAVFENERLTYAVLEEGANQLARFLEGRGAGPGSFIAIYMERSMEMLVAVLGILKCGAAYIPLDPVYPKQRINFILAETGATLVLTQSHIASQLEVDGRNVISIDSAWTTIAKQSGAPITKDVSQDSLAYLIYTSGSTGKPKGVRVRHRALVNFLESMRRKPGMAEHDRLLAVTTLSFDIAGLELFLPLTAGGTVVIAAADAVVDGRRLKELMLTERITLMQATPSTWRLLLDAGWTPTPAVRILCGGEALPRELADQLALEGVQLWNMYGPTETTIWSAVSQVSAETGPVRLGPPIANTHFYVLDALGEPLPLGVAGELYIGGDGVADGYFERPELTAQKFVPNPFLPGGRLFRTGDLVRALPNGHYDFLGRCDDQVKVRGYRIELGEIEAAMASHPDVVDAVVVAREDKGTKRLVGYYTVPGGNATLADVPQLKAFLREKLPAYMIPAALIPLADLPRTPNGKVNRKELPAPDFGSVQGVSFRRPETPNEARLAEICCEVLEVAQVGTDSNLFELGADSIQIFKIVARANRAGIALTVQMVLRQPTIQRMAEAAEASPSMIPRATLGRIVPVSREVYRLNPSRAGTAAGDNKIPGQNGKAPEPGIWEREAK